MATTGETRENISIELVTVDDTDDVVKFLKQHFYKDEPICEYLEMDENQDIENFATHFIPELCSFKALNSQREIIGVLLNGITNRPAPGEPHQSTADKCESPKFRKVEQLMEYIESKFDVFVHYPNIDRYLDAAILSVSPNYRGYGIGLKLTNTSLDYMQEHNIPLMHVLCTSHFSARLLEKMGFEVVYTLPYSEFLVDGVQILKPAAPHLATKILIKHL